MSSDPAPGSPSEGLSVAPGGGAAGACVLVVDDEADIRETLREAVEMMGCTAVLAANGAYALELLRASKPCLMVIDMIMPVMTGEELLEIMRQQPALAQLPVLISTSA